VSETGRHHSWYGRRQGHKLRPRRRALIDTLLPELAIVLPDGDAGLDAAALFEPRREDLWLEIGFGAGEHLAAQAQAHPDVGFIGCEPFVNGVASLLSQIEDQGLANIRIYDEDAHLLFAPLPEACFGRVFIMFPDPWPKKRHHKRRLISPPTLDALARLMKDGGTLQFASDHMAYVRWTLDHFTRHPEFQWMARTAADWRRTPPGAAATRYEQKAISRGLSPAYLTFRRRPRG
jgi:tRNA (guanine-N7-)-methyltransferase